MFKVPNPLRDTVLPRTDEAHIGRRKGGCTSFPLAAGGFGRTRPFYKSVFRPSRQSVRPLPEVKPWIVGGVLHDGAVDGMMLNVMYFDSAHQSREPDDDGGLFCRAGRRPSSNQSDNGPTCAVLQRQPTDQRRSEARHSQLWRPLFVADRAALPRRLAAELRRSLPDAELVRVAPQPLRPEDVGDPG